MSADIPARETQKHRHRKETLRVLLSDRDLKALNDWVVAERNPMRPLSSLLFDHEELMRWRTIEALGLTAAREWRRDGERVRRQIRRLFWLMNDESGGICWHAPEAIAEIIYNVPELIEEYGLQLPSFFVEEPFERGSRWAVARLSDKQPSTFASTVPALVDSLENADGDIRGMSLLALKALRARTGRGKASLLLEDKHTVAVYDFTSGKLTDMTVADLARDYLASV